MRHLLIAGVLGFLLSPLNGSEPAAACPPGCPPGCVAVTAEALPEVVRQNFATLVEPTAITGYRQAEFAGKTVYVALVTSDGNVRVVALDAAGNPVVTVAVCPHCGGHHAHTHE